MRTTLILLAATLPLALCATAGASGIASLDAGVGALGIAAEVPGALAAPDVALDAPSLPRSPFLAPSLPSLDVPLEITARTPHAAIASFPLAPEPRTSLADDDAPAPAAPPVAVQTAAATGMLWLLVERLGLGRALGAAFAALYFRVQPNELLDHERRERVVQLVRERPGIGPSDVANALGTGWGVTSYHLDRLERAGLVTSQRVGQHRCYFLPGAVPRDQQRTVGLFRGDTTRRLAEHVRAKPGLTQSQICAELGLSASAASKQISRLEAAALVRREARDGAQRVYPLPTLSGALAPSVN